MAQLKSSIQITVGVNGAGRLSALTKETEKLSQSINKAAQSEMRMHAAANKAASDRERRASQGQFRLQQAASKIAAQEEARAAKLAQREAQAQAKKEAALARQQAKEEAAAQRLVAREESMRKRQLALIEKNAQKAAAAAEKQAQRETKAIHTVETETLRLQRLQDRQRITNEARAKLGMAPIGGGGGFMTGHGMVNRARQGLAVARDLAVAGMGIRYAISAGIGMANTVLDPMREFQSSMADVRNKGGFTAAQTAEIATMAKSQAGLGVSPTQAAGAAVELAAAGMKAPDIKSALPSTLRFSAASGLGTEASSGLLVETMSQFGMGAGDFGRIGDTLVATANKSPISVADLGEALKYVAPLAAAAGNDIESTSSAIGFLGERGIKGSQAGTALRGIMSSMAKPAKAARDALSSLHLTQTDFQKGITDMPTFFERLSKRMDMKKMNKESRLAILKQLFGQEGMTAATTLMANTEAWREFEKGVRGAGGAMEEAAAIAGNTLDGKMAKLNATVEASKITLGEKFLPMLDKMIPKLTEAAAATGSWIEKHGDLTQAIVGAGAVGAGVKGLSMIPGVGAAASALGGAAKLGAAQLFLPTAAQMTLAGASLGTIFAAATVSAIAGYGITTAILGALDVDPTEWGAKLFDLMNGATPRNNRGKTIAQQIAAEKAAAAERAKAPLDTSGPLLPEEKARREAHNKAMGWQGVGGELQIQLTYDKPPKVTKLKSDGLPLGLSVAPSGK